MNARRLAVLGTLGAALLPAAAPGDRALADTINVFLKSLGISHTELFTPADLEYHLFRGLSRGEPVSHIGIQTRPEHGGHRVLAVWDGLPADRAGLRRGDLIVAAGGEPFEPILSFTGDAPRTLTVLRGADTLRVRVEPVSDTIPGSLRHATWNSARLIRAGEGEIGYVHLWTCVDSALAVEFPRILEEKLGGVDGLVLDLRNGYGGMWQAYLEPFFAKGTSYTPMIVQTMWGAVDTLRFAAGNGSPKFTGPLVVLINEGSRSGLECLAYDLRRQGRAELVGHRTSGAVVGGKWWFHPDGDWALYLAVNAVELEGAVLEGTGVRPDDPVPYPADGLVAPDPQLDAAVGLLKTRLAPAPTR